MKASARAGLVVVLLGVAVGAWWLRQAWIQTWFQDGVPQTVASVAEDAPPTTAGVLAPSQRVRVFVIDGLSATVADALPSLSRLCARGWDVGVDNGFPTVSLPVQHVLWTGKSQWQTGIRYRIPRIDPPVPVPGARSVAVAESHRAIVHSFGFGRIEPGLDDEAIEAPGSAWRREGFEAAALEAVASDARLAFVHVLRVDEAGHAHGRDSSPYAEAARTADALLGRAVEAAGPGATWIVLSDHGHRPDGGHGGAEPSIRIVRGCLVAPSMTPRDARTEAPVRLVDISHELFAALGATPDPEATGRSVAQALASPRPSDVPRPSWLAWALAAGLVLAAIGVVLGLAGAGVATWPWWIPLAIVGVSLVAGTPSLSNPAVYPRLPTALGVAGAPAALLLLVTVARAPRSLGVVRTLVVQLAPGLAWVAAAFVLATLPADATPRVVMPPLVPTWTAQTSVALVMLAEAAGVAALGVVLTSWSRPSARSTSRPTAGS